MPRTEGAQLSVVGADDDPAIKTGRTSRAQGCGQPTRQSLTHC